MPGAPARPSGGVSMMRGTVPSGVTTERGGGSGDGEDEPRRRGAARGRAGSSVMIEGVPPSAGALFLGARSCAYAAGRISAVKNTAKTRM
ncbi:MAG: hypothetical protein GHHEDOFH_01136 [Pseudorhodoplanes sp.]|nr:hypothetical protein [Pseudorhodoplanes sp.]